MSLYIECKYDGELRAYRPGILTSIICFSTKKEATAYTKAIGWTLNTVEPVASRLSGRVWGLMGGGFGMFLKNPNYNQSNGARLCCIPQPTAEEMRAFIDDYFKERIKL